MIQLTPSWISFFKGVGLVILIAVLGFLSQQSNLAGLFSPTVCTLIAGIAVWAESAIEGGTGKSLFGFAQKS